MNTKKMVAIFLMVVMVAILTACSGEAAGTNNNKDVSQPSGGSTNLNEATANTQQNAGTAISVVSVEYDSDDLGTGVSNTDVTFISLGGESVSIDGSGVEVNNQIIRITSAGTYSIQGTLNDGQITVDTEDEATVILELNGADITNSTGAPIYVSNAQKTVITLANGTQNYVMDGTSYVFDNPESDEPNATIFSHDDLTINGSGSLVVTANYNNGIVSKDGLKITGGNITVNATNDGIKGRDYIAIKDGIITVTAGGDGLQSNNDEDITLGYVLIEGGSLNITAALDGVQAETSLLVNSGDLTIVSGGGNLQTSDSGDSSKGLKAGVNVTVDGGTILIDSLDDAIHSNNSIIINGGNLSLASGDDGIHSDSTLEINGGDLTITRSYEGIESSVITINDGNIHLAASDDGVNASSGDAAGAEMGRPMGGPVHSEIGDNYLYVNGGYLFVDAWGDGIDINGPILMTGGVVIVNGPIANNNGALDYTGDFQITGGFLIAVGSAGMAQAPGTTSTQYSVMHIFTSLQPAGTLIHIEAEDGEDILTFMPTKDYQSIVISSPALNNGSTYYVYSGGNSSGTVFDGLYSGGIYTGGTQVSSFTISSIVTGANNPGGGLVVAGRALHNHKPNTRSVQILDFVEKLDMVHTKQKPMENSMSLKDPFPEKVPEETARLVEPLLPGDSVYRLVAECVDEFLSDEQFIELYADEGRPGINPVILSLVTICQFLEKLPDRAAAEMAEAEALRAESAEEWQASAGTML